MIDLQSLTGRFHCHITYETSNEIIEIPAGWKKTIILLDKGDRHQTDVMITRHFKMGTGKFLSDFSLRKAITDAVIHLELRGCNVTRVKLEHEDFPTLKPSQENYREVHVKVRVPHGKQFLPRARYVRSSNPFEIEENSNIYFWNARFYSGEVIHVDETIRREVRFMQSLNPDCEILEVKIETAVHDSNPQSDAWWS